MKPRAFMGSVGAMGLALVSGCSGPDGGLAGEPAVASLEEPFNGTITFGAGHTCSTSQ